MLAKLFASQLLRLILQVTGLLLASAFLLLIILGFPFAIHALCPYAAVCFGMNKYVLLGISATAFWLTVCVAIGILISSMFFGRKFCGYICPLGTWQEAIYAFHRLKYRRRHRIPYFAERRLIRLKILVLAASLLLSGFGIAYFYINLCPLYALSLLPRLAIPGLGVFLLISLGSFFWERAWCRWLCPYAVLLNIFQWLGGLFGIRRTKIRRNLERCIDCGLCSIYCPMNLNITAEEYVQSPDCIHCLMCAEKCPKPGSH